MATAGSDWESNIVRTSCTDSVHRVERQYLSQRVRGVRGTMRASAVCYTSFNHPALRNATDNVMPPVSKFESSSSDRSTTIMAPIEEAFAGLKLDDNQDVGVVARKFCSPSIDAE